MVDAVFNIEINCRGFLALTQAIYLMKPTMELAGIYTIFLKFGNTSIPASFCLVSLMRLHVIPF